MKIKFKEIKFNSLFRIPTKNGVSKPQKIRGDGYKMINMGELFANNRIMDIPMELVPLSQNEIKNNEIKENDLLFARQSLVLSGAGKCSIVKEINEYTTFESHIIRVRLNSEIANPDFYFYYFNSKKSPIKSIVQQCAQAGIRASDLANLNVIYPSINFQNKIANILSNYDDLIENNKKQIKLLEETTERIYKEWFIKLNYPNHENEEIINGLPKDWKISKVADVIRTVPKTKSVKKQDILNIGTYPVIDQSKDFIAGYSNETEAVINSQTPVIIFGDHTRILKLIDFPFIRGADGTQAIISNHPSIKEYQLYCALKSIDLSNYSYARHFKYLKEEKIIIPNGKIGTLFEDYIKPVFDLIKNLRNRILLLQEARDKLLPKLLNGDIEV